jgi:hypothetical protein
MERDNPGGDAECGIEEAGMQKVDQDDFLIDAYIARGAATRLTPFATPSPVEIAV